MSRFGWAYLGCGSIAHITAGELSRTDDNRIVSVWNRTYGKAEAFAKKYGCTAYRTIEEAILAPGVDGVYIAVTADMHAEFMKLCIRHHKPVLCEKPFTVNAAQAQEVFDYASWEGVYVSEAMWTWHNRTAEQVRKWISDRAAGDILSVNCNYSFPMMKISKKERHTSPDMIGGALLDIGVYCVRYCYELFGMPESVTCEGRLCGGIDLGEHVTLHYRDFDADLRISRDEFDGEKIQIVGKDGTVTVPMFHMAKKAVLKGKRTVRFRCRDRLFARQFSAVAAEIRSSAAAGIAITPQSTVDCLKILDECRKQMGLVYPCEL